MLAVFTLVAAFAAAALAAPADPILGVTIAAPAATTTAAGPNPTEVFINSISYGGTGCPQGTVGSFISADRQTFVFPKNHHQQFLTRDLASLSSSTRMLRLLVQEFPLLKTA